MEIYVLSSRTHSQRRFPPSTTVSDLQAKLEIITGIPTFAQTLQIYRSGGLGEGEEGELIRTIDVSAEARKGLEEVGIRDGMTIKVVGANDGDDVAEEEASQKFDITQEEYEKRSDSLLAFKQRNKLGRFGADTTIPEPVPTGIEIGNRCEVEGGRRGTVKFLGTTDFAKGVWVGVEYDEPVGKNDGSVNGKQYFEAKQNYGGFVKPEKVQVGDFQVRDIEEEIEEM